MSAIAARPDVILLVVSKVEVPLTWRIASPDTIIEAISSGTVRAAAVLSRQSPDNLKKIKRNLRERISAFRQNGMYAVPMPALVVTGIR